MECRSTDCDKPVYFVAHHLRRRWPELDHPRAGLVLEEVPPTRWAPLENIWIVSTYLRLRHSMPNVRIVERPVPGEINICCDVRAGVGRETWKAFLVQTQADRDPLPWADYCLVQSPEQMSQPCSSWIGHWTQPGLIPRDARRGSRLERIGYIGPVDNLAGGFRSDGFRHRLRELGMELVIRDNPVHWNDFSDLDIYLAVRDWPWAVIRTKPCTKLVHAWISGAIGLMGPEPSYRYWGKDGEDYFEVRNPEQALNVIRRLQQDPSLCERVRQNGFVKGRAHDESAVVRQWVQVLNGPVQSAFDVWRQANAWVWCSRRARRAWQSLISPISHKIFTLQSWGWRAFTIKGKAPQERMSGQGESQG